MFRNMATSLVTHERIETTLCKAKEMRSIADHLITLGKRNDLHARRQALSFIRSDSVVAKLFSDLAPRFKERNGGYTRVLHLGERMGDAAPMALIEYLPGEGTEAQETAPKKGEKKAQAKKPAKADKKEKPAEKAAPTKAEKKAEKAKKKEEKARKKDEKAKKKEAEKAKKKEEKKPAKKEAKKKSK